MCWYPNKLTTALFYGFILLILVSCGSDVSSPSGGDQNRYYPLLAFFEAEVDSLQRINPTLSKTVRKDGQEESKSMIIRDWKTEMGAFLSVDLSKPVYKDAFEIVSEDSVTRYIARDKALDIQSVVLENDGAGLLKKVTIERRADNFLYKNQEKLEYLRKGYYNLEKNQKILLLGESEYWIEGRL